MIVSWNWLKEYVALDMPVEQLEMRLTMAGLNHEGTERVGDDLAIDLEVTSNRPDCLGHLGVAREIAVLWDQDLRIPATPVASGPRHWPQNRRLSCGVVCRRANVEIRHKQASGRATSFLID